MFSEFLKLITNRFVLVALAFLVWILFFDKNDFINQRQKTRELNQLKAKITYYNQEISTMDERLKALQTDPGTLEKYAREKYFMKRGNEDVYVIEN